MTTAWLAGGSGLVGGELLRLLLQDEGFERVVSVGRRRLPLEHPKLVQVVTDFAAPLHLPGAPAPDVAFGCLGTTIKKAGSRAAFEAVDHGAVVAFAAAAKVRGARVFAHVTALGANPRSSIFYNRVKGAVEASVAALGLPSVYAIRPSILDGPRPEPRPGERIGLAVARALGPLLGKSRPTPAAAVARKLVDAAREAAPGAHVVEPGRAGW